MFSFPNSDWFVVFLILPTLHLQHAKEWTALSSAPDITAGVSHVYPPPPPSTSSNSRLPCLHAHTPRSLLLLLLTLFFNNLSFPFLFFTWRCIFRSMQRSELRQQVLWNILLRAYVAGTPSPTSTHSYHYACLLAPQGKCYHFRLD